MPSTYRPEPFAGALSKNPSRAPRPWCAGLSSYGRVRGSSARLTRTGPAPSCGPGRSTADVSPHRPADTSKWWRREALSTPRRRTAGSAASGRGESAVQPGESSRWVAGGVSITAMDRIAIEAVPR